MPQAVQRLGGRPILLAVGKKDKDLLNTLVSPVDAVISSLQSNGVTIAIVGQAYSLKVMFIRSMNEGKMQKLL